MAKNGVAWNQAWEALDSESLVRTLSERFQGTDEAEAAELAAAIQLLGPNPFSEATREELLVYATSPLDDARSSSISSFAVNDEFASTGFKYLEPNSSDPNEPDLATFLMSPFQKWPHRDNVPLEKNVTFSFTLRPIPAPNRWIAVATYRRGASTCHVNVWTPNSALVGGSVGYGTGDIVFDVDQGVRTGTGNIHNELASTVSGADPKYLTHAQVVEHLMNVLKHPNDMLMALITNKQYYDLPVNGSLPQPAPSSMGVSWNPAGSLQLRNVHAKFSYANIQTCNIVHFAETHTTATHHELQAAGLIVKAW